MLEEVEICLVSTCAVKPRFDLSTFCMLYDFTHFLYGPEQVSTRTMFPRFYAMLGGSHKNVKLGFYSACFT